MTTKRRGAYAPLSATYAADDAIMEAGEAAELLFVRALAFCANQDSDGFITRAQLVRWVGAGMLDAEDRAKKLVEVGLFGAEHGGYQIRSWLSWNESTEDKGRRKRQDRERKAAGRAAVQPDTVDDSGPEDDPPPPPVPSDMAPESTDVSERSPNGQGPDVRTESGRTGSRNPCLDTGQDRTATGQDNTTQRAARKRAARQERASPMPDDFVLDDLMVAFAGKYGMSTDLARREYEAFCAYHGSKGNRFVDWRRAWQTWVHRWAERHRPAASGTARPEYY